MEVDGLSIQVEAAVSDKLPAGVLLGTDVPALHTLLGTKPLPAKTPDVLVVTRAQARRQLEEELLRREKQVQLEAVQDIPQEVGKPGEGGSMTEEESIEQGLSRRQRRAMQQELYKPKVPVAAEDQHKTAFTTPMGLFQFRVMPFGLSGAPASFQRMADQLVDGIQNYAAAYLDDLVVFSSTWEDHLKQLQEILSRLRQAGLTAKPSKCQFGMRTCTYLGHVVGNGLIKPEVSKIQAVQSFAVPQSKRQVRAFLGLTGYYRRFIPGYAEIAAPLTDLTKKCAPNSVKWTNSCDTAFVTLKKLLCSPPVLRSPDFTKPFVLQTDASDIAVGAVLSQQDESGHDHPVAYFSRKLLPREVRYSTVEKECLAIRLATHAFRVYLLGREFVIETDHRSLEWLDRLKENNARLTRWSLALQPFSFSVVYRPGLKNGNADALSRAATN